MAQYLKPDCALGYVEDTAQIEYLKFNNLRHVALGCMLGDFDDVGTYVVSPEIVKELVSIEKYIVQSYDNIELCKSAIKFDKQISFLVTFEGNKATLSLVEKINYEANFALNSGTYSNINEFVLDVIETNGEVDRNAVYIRWNIKTFPSQIIDIFNCDNSVMEKYFGIVNRLKYLMKANTVLLQKETQLEEIESSYANQLFEILSHYPKLEKAVLETIKTTLKEKKDAVNVEKPFFAKTLNEVIENAIQKNINVLDETEKQEFAQEQRNAVVEINIKRADALPVENVEIDHVEKNEITPKVVVIQTPAVDKPLNEIAKDFIQESKDHDKEVAESPINSSDLLARTLERNKGETKTEKSGEEEVVDKPEPDTTNGENEKPEKQRLLDNLSRKGLGAELGIKPKDKIEKGNQQVVGAETNASETNTKQTKPEPVKRTQQNNANTKAGNGNRNSTKGPAKQKGGKATARAQDGNTRSAEAGEPPKARQDEGYRNGKGRRATFIPPSTSYNEGAQGDNQGNGQKGEGSSANNPTTKVELLADAAFEKLLMENGLIESMGGRVANTQQGGKNDVVVGQDDAAPNTDVVVGRDAVDPQNNVDVGQNVGVGTNASLETRLISTETFVRAQFVDGKVEDLNLTVDTDAMHPDSALTPEDISDLSQ